MNSSNTDSKVVINLINNALVATIQVSLSESVLKFFKQDLLEKLASSTCRYLILDFSGLDIIDPHEFNEIQKIIRMSDIMGTKSLCVGLNPSVVASLIQLEVDVSDIRSALNIEAAFAIISKESS